MSQNQDKFIILRKFKYSESDLILHALSSEGEKCSFIARGALKSKKRFGGGILEPSHYVRFTFKANAEDGQLRVLNEAVLIDDFAGIRTDYDRLEFALQILDCVSKVSQEGDRSSDFLFNLLGHTLRALESAPDVLILKMHFYLKFMLQQGVIQSEDWMVPFLRTKISDSPHLAPLRQIVDEELSHVEIMVKHYLQNATL